MWFHKKNEALGKAGLKQALGIVGYVALFTTFVTSAGKFMPGPDPVWAPLLFLSIFCFSVMACGLIVFYKPYMLFIDKKPKAAGELVFATAKWLGIFVAVIIIGAFVITR